MDAATEERLQQDIRRAGAARVCSFLFLMISTLMVVRIQQSRLEAATRSRDAGKFQFSWEASPFLTSDSALLTSAYLDGTQEYSSVFRSHKRDVISKTLLASSSSNLSFFENYRWDDPIFSNLSVTPDGFIPSPVPVLSLSMDVSSLYSPEYLPECQISTPRSSPLCYVSLISTSIETCKSSSSWTCRLYENTNAIHDIHTKCIYVVGSSNTASIRLESARFSFCGSPVRHLIAIDGVQRRIFFVQRLRSIYTENNVDTVKTDSTGTAEGFVVENQVNNSDHTSMFSKYCISTVHLDPYYGDVSECIQIATPKGILFNRPPVHLHYDTSTRALAIFNFDVSGSLVATVVETTPDLPTRFSIRLEYMKSGWLLLSDDTSRSSLLILGDKVPYLGVLHVIDLESAKDTRLDLEKKFSFNDSDRNLRGQQ